MKKYRLYDIKWDLEDDESEEETLTPEEAGVPTELTIEVDDDFDPQEEAADYLSDHYGWCVFGLDFEELRD